MLIAATVGLIVMHYVYPSLEVIPVLFIFAFGGLYLLRDEYIVQPGGQTMTLSYHDVAIILGKQNQKPIVFIADEVDEAPNQNRVD